MANHVPAGRPPAVLVTVLDENKFGARYMELIKENRQLYAKRHGTYCRARGRGGEVCMRLTRRYTHAHTHIGYATFFPQVGNYELNHAPSSWTKVVAMRHALSTFPDATYFWFVDVDTFIMNPQLSIEKDVMAAATLENSMLVDHPVVPPDSIIKTFTHLSGEDIDLVLTQDKEGLATSSFVLRNSEWARFMLETWFDPMYRSYNFQKAETHALVSDQ